MSPDGEAIAFFSDRSQHSIDMVVADTRTGAVRRRVVKTEGDPHFESLQFIESAGAWAPDGRRLAMAALSGGAPVLTILNAASGSVERELPIRHADQVFSPTWSPDGKRIAFSVLHNGFSDLEVIDLETGAVRPLTSDAFADLHPAWSPDGRTIAFSTDRFSSSLETLTFGEFRLASIDVESGTIDALPSIPSAKNIDPHWTAGRQQPVLHRRRRRHEQRLSPRPGRRRDLQDHRRVRRRQRNHRAQPGTGRRGTRESARLQRLPPRCLRNSAAWTPPMDRALLPASAAADDNSQQAVTPAAATVPQRTVAGAVSAPTFGLQDGSQFTSKPYRAALSLDRVVQPYLTAAGGGTGGSLRGGVGLSFGDMLGDQAGADGAAGGQEPRRFRRIRWPI